MAEDLHVRRATTKDIGILVGLMREFYGEATYSLDEGWATATFHSLLEHEDDGCVWIVSAAGRPIGHAVLTTRFAMEHGGLCGYVDDIFVEKDYRRRGSAHLLLTELEKESVRRGCKAIVVEVGKANVPALRTYQKLGMRLIDDGRVLYRKVLS